MNFNKLIQYWCNSSYKSKILIVTDNVQYEIAETIKNDVDNDCEIRCFETSDNLMDKIKLLSKDDILIVLLSLHTFLQLGANKLFSPFNNPSDVVARYVFIRLSITKDSLLQGLSTPKNLIYSKIDEMNNFNSNSLLCVKNKAGTDITLKIGSFVTCSHEITSNCNYAFLPPSETSSDVISGTTSGKIVIDVTIGQLYYYGELLGNFGLVTSPITLIVENGFIKDIYGDDMAIELKEKLFKLPVECREIVELGQGLSKMSPTGLIGVDESIIDTCHFGIGDGGKCGVHLDVVISNPSIQKF